MFVCLLGQLIDNIDWSGYAIDKLHKTINNNNHFYIWKIKDTKVNVEMGFHNMNAYEFSGKQIIWRWLILDFIGTNDRTLSATILMQTSHLSLNDDFQNEKCLHICYKSLNMELVQTSCTARNDIESIIRGARTKKQRNQLYLSDRTRRTSCVENWQSCASCVHCI